MKCKYGILIIVVVLSFDNGSAQIFRNEPAPDVLSRWMASMYLDWGIASNLYARNLYENHGFGLGGELLYNMQHGRPLWGGVGVHSFLFDDDKLRYSQEFDGVLYTYEEHTASRVFIMHGILRFQPPVRFFLHPYVQGTAGVHWFFTNTKIQDVDSDEQVDRINDSRDSKIGFALHAGVQYVAKECPVFRYDVRIGYFRNASVEYLRYNPNINGGSFPIDFFESKISAVDMFGIHIGITAVISSKEEDISSD